MHKKLSLLTKLQFEQLSVQKDAFSRAKENSEWAGTWLEYSNKKEQLEILLGGQGACCLSLRTRAQVPASMSKVSCGFIGAYNLSTVGVETGGSLGFADQIQGQWQTLSQGNKVDNGRMGTWPLLQSSVCTRSWAHPCAYTRNPWRKQGWQFYTVSVSPPLA